jgi:amidase
LRAAGALIFGKTVTCEFAGPAAGPTTNPHDSARTPGGSSSGSGAAVADHMVPFAFGTQTGGSVQRPSSFCGIVGYKPSFGLVNPHGVKPAAESLDTVGLMVRAVEDAELFMRVLTNGEPVQWFSETPPVRVGLCRTFAWDRADEATRTAVEDAARRLERAGFTVGDVELPPPCEELPRTRELINDFERARGMSWEWNTHREQLSEQLTKAIRNGLAIPRAQYVEALQRLELCRRQAARLFDHVDVLLTPTVDGEAPLGLVSTGNHRFQSIWTQLRTPAVTLPTHAGPNGMPVGIQLIGPVYGDDKLLAIAQHVFAVLGRGPQIAL